VIDRSRALRFHRSAMRNTLLLILCVAFLSGCAGSLPHEYYNATVPNPPDFKGPLSVEIVGNVDLAVKEYVADGYTVIGSSIYQGDRPKGAEIEAQARRVHATKVVYEVSPSAMGNMQMHVGLVSGGISEANDVSIVYLGK
jgi:hypothetical protein